MKEAACTKRTLFPYRRQYAIVGRMKTIRTNTPETIEKRRAMMVALNEKLKSDPTKLSESRRKSAHTREMRRKQALERIAELEDIVERLQGS